MDIELATSRSSGYVPPREDGALGIVATHSFPAIVGTADMMLKSADVTLVGYEKVGGGHCAAIVRGKTADVRLAVEEGAKTAEQFGQLISKTVIPRPLLNLEAVFPIGTRLAELARQERGFSRLSNHALGLLETRGFPAMVGAADAMLKSADVQLASYETIGDGLCTAIVRGTVANVAMAIEVGMLEAERIGELHSVMVVPRILEDLEYTLPVAEYWLERTETEPLPLMLPKDTANRRRPPIALPELERVPLPLEEASEAREVRELEIIEEPAIAEPAAPPAMEVDAPQAEIVNIEPLPKVPEAPSTDIPQADTTDATPKSKELPPADAPPE